MGLLPGLGRIAKELVAKQPDLIVGHTTPVDAALQRETSAIPIVFVTVSDPVGSGFVASLPRPGGQITGFINIEASLSGKWIELLKEIVPRITRAGLMFNPETAPYFAFYQQPFEAAAHANGVERTEGSRLRRGRKHRDRVPMGARRTGSAAGACSRLC